MNQEYLSQKLDVLEKRIAKVREIMPQLSAECGIVVDMDTTYCFRATRNDLRLMMSLLPGQVFDKAKFDNDIHYTFDGVIDGNYMRMVIATSELPPTCRLEEYEELVPAQPAREERVVKKMRLVCNQRATEPDEVAAAISDGRIGGPSEAQDFIQMNLK